MLTNGTLTHENTREDTNVVKLTRFKKVTAYELLG